MGTPPTGSTALSRPNLVDAPPASTSPIASFVRESSMRVLIDWVTGTQTGLTVALLIFFLAWESFLPFFSFFRGRTRERRRHLVRNFVLMAVNSVVIAAVFVAAWTLAATWSDRHDMGLLHRLLPDGAVRVVIAVLLLDAWTYVLHRLYHAVPLLWRLHVVHHTDTRMDVSTSGRFHVGEILVSSAVRIPIIVLLGVRLKEILIFETLMLVVGQFHHANISVAPALDRILRSLIVTPTMHRVHHSRKPDERNANFSSLLSVWDRLGGTFRLVANPAEIEFGVERRGTRDPETMLDLFRMPIDSSVSTSASAPAPIDDPPSV